LKMNSNLKKMLKRRSKKVICWMVFFSKFQNFKKKRKEAIEKKKKELRNILIQSINITTYFNFYTILTYLIRFVNKSISTKVKRYLPYIHRVNSCFCQKSQNAYANFLVYFQKPQILRFADLT
jgi:hypothetical protein